MSKTVVFESISKFAIGKVIPVYFRNYNYCRLRTMISIDKESRLVSEVVPDTIIIGNQTSWKYIFDYLTEEQKKVWKKYSPFLFSILHEIGHSQTLEGLNYEKIKNEKKSISIFSADEKEVSTKYRKIEDEARADQWATEWVINNSELAKGLDKQIRKYYK